MADTPPRRVCVIGLGYVGLPTAASIAAQGVEVIGVDVDAGRLSAIASGAARTAEEDLNDLVRTVVAAGTLSTAATPRPADAFIIAVPTPHGPDHAPDVSFVRAAADSLAPLLRPGNLVVLESTSPVGTTEDLCVWLAESRGDLSFPHRAGEDSDVRVAYSPERAIPGNMLHELTNNHRVIGGITAACAAAAAGLYRVFVKGAVPHDYGAHRRAGEAHRECVPGRQHRLRERDLAGVRLPRNRSLGAHRAGQPPSAGRHPATGAGSRRPLHRGRSVVHRPLGAGADAAHPGRTASEQRQAALGCAAGPRRLPRPRPPHHRLPGARLKADVGDLRESPPR